MELNNSNYFSKEADLEYMSVSNFKSFLEIYGGCEAAAMAKLKGEFKQSNNTALLVGSYVHSHFENALGTFKAENPGIFTKAGDLKSDYKLANEMINCLETDENFQKVYQGEKEIVVTGELFGVKWKAKADLLNLDKGYFVDLKTCRDFERQWNPLLGGKVTFVENFGYLVQIAVYRELIAQQYNIKPQDLEGFIIAVTKQTPPDKIILNFIEDDYQYGLHVVEQNIKRVMDVKEGREEPKRCEHCEYCRSTKQLTHTVHWTEL